MSFAKEAAAFKALYLVDDICVYLPTGSVISNTVPLSPLWARIVPLCMWTISFVKAPAERLF